MQNINQFPFLQTERLTLRKLKDSDAQSIFNIRSNDNVVKYINRNKQSNIQEAIDFIDKMNKGIEDKTWLIWAITLNSNNELIGTVCFWNFSYDYKTAEIGYEIHPNYQGKGLMHEALNSVIKYGFDVLELDTIEAFTHYENKSSINLLNKLNFKTFNNNKIEENGFVIYSLSNF